MAPPARDASIGAMTLSSDNDGPRGPLAGIRVVEIGSIGPGPFCAMVLADLGADVLRVDRLSGAGLCGPSTRLLDRAAQPRPAVGRVDLKHPGGRRGRAALVEQADALIEGFRPGVCERLGIGPDECLARNPRLVYGRMTGYGQDGPMAQAVGHDINYIAQAGRARHDRPPRPAADAAAEPGRRLRRRRADARARHRRGAGRARDVRQGPGRRRRDGRGRRAAGHAVLRLPADRRVERRSAARTSSTAARRSTTRTSARTASTSRGRDGAEVLRRARRAAAAWRTCPTSTTRRAGRR